MSGPVSALLLLFVTSAAATVPRLVHDLTDNNSKRASFQQVEQFATTLLDGTDLYVGGNGVLYRIDFDVSSTLTKIDLPDGPRKCRRQSPDSCANYIMVLQRFDAGHLLLCATGSPSSRCWLAFNNTLKEFINGQNRVLGSHILPGSPQQGFASLVVEQRIYSAAPLDGNKMLLSGYRKTDDIKRLKTDARWMNDPRFVAMAPVDDLIYMFFRERNLQSNPDVDPWISRVARVCKDDQGGSRRRLQMEWSTFLKARLLCNQPANNVHFNRIEDTFIYKSPVDGETRVYGVFSSNWNGTAVCVYSMKEIRNVFATSGFKDSKGPVPHDPRPGTCVNNTKELPDEVLALVEDHPEMDSWIHPIGRYPLMTSKETHIKRIVVDSTIGLHGEEFRLLFLAMGDGTIHKVLETGTSVFIIAKLNVLKQPAPILSMSLDSARKLLYVTSTMELVRFPLVQCEQYVGSCASCVQARDPYCGWDPHQKKCVPVVPNLRNGLQNLISGDGCTNSKVAMLRSSIQRPPSDATVLHLPLGEDIPVYISCPKQSYHADYTWRFNSERELPCSSNDDNCLLLIRQFTEDKAGSYECFSHERGAEQLHASYYLQGSTASTVHLSSVAFYSVLVTALCQVLQWF